MRTTTFKTILDSIAKIYGEDELTTEDLSFAAASIDTDYLNEVWTFADWPELEVIEQRTYAPIYDAATAYVLDDTVYHEGAYYDCLTAGTGNTPGETVAWTEAEDLARMIEFVEAGKTSIGIVNTVTISDPRQSGSNCQIDFTRREDSIQILDNVAAPWVRFTRREPRVTTTAYNAATDYVTGDVVYDATGGNCYQALQDSTGEPVTEAAYWSVQEIPHFCQAYLIRAALADLYDNKDQDKKAAKQEGLAQDRLSRAYHVQQGREGQQDKAQL